MKRHKFKTGDKIQCTPGEYNITKIKHRPEMRTSIHIFPETFVYRLNDSHSWWFEESILQSQIECINCGNTGWDWHIGCNFCGLTPEDFS
jgi:hypothetical protein